jgi:type I restriction enzyme R subunit
MLTPERHARQLIDDQLTAASWLVQDYKQLNLGAAPRYPLRDWTRQRARVRGAGPKTLLTNLVSLVRFALHQTDTLTAYPLVDERYQAWLATQATAGRAFSPEQQQWLHMMKEKVATSLSVEAEDFILPPFVDQGGYALRQVFGADLQQLVDELNDALAA